MKEDQSDYKGVFSEHSIYTAYIQSTLLSIHYLFIDKSSA